MRETSKLLLPPLSPLNLLVWASTTTHLRQDQGTTDVAVHTLTCHQTAMVFMDMVLDLTTISSRHGTRNIPKNVQKKHKVLMGRL